MGIPKFFRYISERYPCLTEKLKDHQIPDFDNLYLDVNGIIHVCSHPDDKNVLFRISEETIFTNIFRYIELLFCMIQPRKLFFLAIDGVAPRAKINQQRSRRFRAAKDAEVQEMKAKAKGIILPKEKRFDSNCITPGTAFMAKLDEQMKYFITYKISSDKLWQRCKVIFSGSQVPGEGEHKIMDYIRYMKAQPDYDINTNHCLYGLDADLIMLGLCTHEIHFTLLREEVVFGNKQTKICLTPEETKFCLFHLSLLRDYIDHEFSLLKEKLPFPYDLEKIIDDWVLMGFLIGNDFIPHLPNLHIMHSALSILSQEYMEVLPTLDGYINETGTLRLDRFEKFMERLSKFDMLKFSEYHADVKYLESKTGRPLVENERVNHIKSDSSDGTPSPKRMPDKEIDALLRSAAEMSIGRYDDEDGGDDESDSEIYSMEFVQRKRDYYMNKLKYENIDEDFLRSQAECYVRAIQWNLNYYYNGCCSWSWYYPHHYAPYISDIKNFKDLKLEFEMGEPFLPFEQLLAALPAYSKELLPAAFQPLVTEGTSPIIDYYPDEFQTDLNGKEREWEAVVLIPFIDAKDLLEAMAPHYAKLTSEERARNKHGPMCLFSYTENNLGVYKVPEYFPEVNVINHAQVQLISREDIFVPREKLIRGLCPGVKRDVYYPGFPTLQYVEHTACLAKSEVKVFQRPSFRESMILHITPSSKTSLTTIATKLLGKTVYVNWPHLKEAFVIAVSNSHSKLNWVNSTAKEVYEHINEEEWDTLRKRITDTYKVRFGVEVGETKYLVHAQLLVGKKYIFGSHGNMHVEKQWADSQTAYAYQTIVKDITVHPNNIRIYNSVDDIFKPGTVCFMLGHPYYGSMGKVRESGVCKKSGRIKVSVTTMREPSFEMIKQIQADLQVQYMHGSLAARRLGISPLILSKITGTIFVKQSSDGLQQDETTYNIGLNLKFTKQNAEIRGYTRRAENGQWFYSVKAIELIRSYMLKYPTIFERLAQNPTACIYQIEDFFTKGSTELNDTVAWLKEQLHGIETRACGTESIENSLMKKLEEDIEAYLKSNVKKVVYMQVQPYLLYTPGLHLRNFPPDPKAHTLLLDRICCVKDNFTVPLGYKGTVIGIQKMEPMSDTMYEVLFDKPFIGGLSINGSSEFRVYRLSPFDFINISYGERVEHGRVALDANAEHAEPWNTATNQEAQSRGNASAFASYRNENHLPVEASMSPKSWIAQKYIDRTTNNQPQIHKYKQYNMQNSTNAWDSYRPVRNAQPSQNMQKSSAEPTSEFQAIWNELHKKQEPNKIVRQVPMAPKLKQMSKGFAESSPQDPSAFLKAVLKIPDENAQQPPVPGVSRIAKRSNSIQKEDKALDTPPLVQQLFDKNDIVSQHARQNEKVKDDKTPIWYCSQLLNYYQLRGIGMPRYSYFANGETTLIQAHILLPDKRIFVGDPCVTHEQAAGNAAKKVYTELKLANVLPNMKIFLPPPHWYSNSQNSNWSPNIRPPGNYYSTEPKLPEWVQKDHYNSGPQHTFTQNEHQKHYNIRPNTASNEAKFDTKNILPFVPLQAQKKSRHVTTANKQATSKENANQSAKDNLTPTAGPKKTELPAKTTKTETVNATTKKQKIAQNKPVQNKPVQNKPVQGPNQVQNTQTVIKPKKSRVAAKFGGTPTQTEKNNDSKDST
ncbi:5'-3' exoribonuclease pacman isoform X1 [Xylocopa sonorina]|uniref:5'-3' exoribonuclease pacman isoform X1 n=1 Tax=Xylocopa sonorina TaxID=1818115 RepID=UPI00403B2CFB